MKSGISTLPLVLSLVASSVAAGGVTQKIGYYIQSMLVSPAIMSVGEGLLSTLNRDSPTAHWVAFQFPLRLRPGIRHANVCPRDPDCPAKGGHQHGHCYQVLRPAARRCHIYVGRANDPYQRPGLRTIQPPEF